MCNRIVAKAVKYYDEIAHQYSNNVYEKVRGELLETLFSQLYVFFEMQMKTLRREVLTQFDTKMKKLCPRDKVNEDFLAEAKQLLANVLNMFVDRANSCVVPESKWEEVVHTHAKELEEHMQRELKAQREKQLDKLVGQKTKVVLD